MTNQEQLDLIIIIAQYKDEKKVLKAVLKAGAPAATYFYGRGTGVRQRLGFLGHFIQEEKVILMTAVPASKSAGVIKSINESAGLDKPGKGFACVLKLDQVLGYV